MLQQATFCLWTNHRLPPEMVMVHPCQHTQFAGTPTFPQGPHGPMVVAKAIELNFPVPKANLAAYLSWYLIAGVKCAESVEAVTFSPDGFTAYVNYRANPEFKALSVEPVLLAVSNG